MPFDKPYKDIPGTAIFDVDQSRKGHGRHVSLLWLVWVGHRGVIQR